jgi:valyl-tRNA synthetase
VSPLEHCDDDGLNDGKFAFDLTQLNAAIIGTQAPAVFTVAYFPTQADAVLETNQVATPTAFLTGEDVWAVVTNTATGCRSAAISIDVHVETLAEPVISSVEGGTTICVDFVTGALLSGLTLTSNIDNTDDEYTFEWFKDGTSISTAETITVTDTAAAMITYTLQVTSTTDLACPSVMSVPFIVERSGPAVAQGTGYTVTGAFAENQTINVHVEGYGDYEYSLDGGPFIANGGVFTNVGLGQNYDGEHTILVRDANGCGPELPIGIISTIDYPPYFTPNGDGVHDTWNIIGLGASQPSAKIYIFDRYGKLIKQISPLGEGWDGTYNGQLMPSTDYWFKVEYAEAAKNTEFKAHFSLKR